MSYRFSSHETVLENLKRIAHEQNKKAIREIEDNKLGFHKTVHQVRKRCKKIRGLIRLVRPQFEDTYKDENAWYRNAARDLSEVRDVQSILEIYKKIVSRYEDQIEEDAFGPIHDYLLDWREEVTRDKSEMEKRLEKFRLKMYEGRARINSWRLEDEGFEAISGGLHKTYKRGRKAFYLAYEKPSPENFHDWRKRVKYHWYHTRLLSEIWPKLMKKYISETHLLSDYLGDSHDLAILENFLQERQKDLDQEQSLMAMFGFIKQERKALHQNAKSLGQRIYCDKPKYLVNRFGCYWDDWFVGRD